MTHRTNAVAETAFEANGTVRHQSNTNINNTDGGVR